MHTERACLIAAPRRTDEDETVPDSGPGGIYGVSLAGLPGVAHLLNPADPSWPTVTVTRTRRSCERHRVPGAEVITGADAHYDLQAAQGHVHVERAAMSVRFFMAQECADDLYVHPLLALPGAIITSWLGRFGFHAGVFATRSGAWAVLGDRETGKSSLLGQLHLLGVPVLTDDVAVVQDGVVYPGPASIDLRPEAAAALGIGTDLGVVGARRRHRVLLGGSAEPLELAGWVVPEFGARCTVDRIPAGQALATLLNNLALSTPPSDPAGLLDLAARPMLRWRRPRDWSAMIASARTLLEATAG